MAGYALGCCVLFFAILELVASSTVRQYCIIGAGPAGMQMGYFLQSAGRDYVVLERNATAGAFFQQFPRHRKLISINKRHTGGTNKEFNLRHDWHSLFSNDSQLEMRHYSTKYFPDADEYVHYLHDYAEKLKLNIEYNTQVTSVGKEGANYVLADQNGGRHLCQVVIVSTGIWVPNIPKNACGIELAVGYESVSTNPADFEGKVVLILGRGNSGFETADSIVGSAGYIHMASRTRIRLAYQTHYVGDVRAVNDQLVDTYQLKSLDGQFEGSLGHVGEDSSVCIQKQGDGKFYLVHNSTFKEIRDLEDPMLRHPYDVIIRCLGFKFDFGPFNGSVSLPPAPQGGGSKYPAIKPNYEAIHASDLYVAGTISHSLDFRKSSGGFVHGFRYTVRALFRHFEWRYHQVAWPSITLPVVDLFEHMLKRINEASGPYQMFGVLADIAIIRENATVEYLEEVPRRALSTFQDLTGHGTGPLILWTYQYGKSYSGPGKDVLREDRATGEPLKADKSNFLHPVIYYYEDPTKVNWNSDYLPEPTRYHHIIEDFLTDWTQRRLHQIPMRRFLEAIFQTDLRSFFAENCFEYILTYGRDIPLYCKQHYLQGNGIAWLGHMDKVEIGEDF
eukprot:Em0020g786a